jgi:hypothetical protein
MRVVQFLFTDLCRHWLVEIRVHIFCFKSLLLLQQIGSACSVKLTLGLIHVIDVVYDRSITFFFLLFLRLSATPKAGQA